MQIEQTIYDRVRTLLPPGFYLDAVEMTINTLSEFYSDSIEPPPANILSEGEKPVFKVCIKISSEPDVEEYELVGEIAQFLREKWSKDDLLVSIHVRQREE